MPIVLYCLWLVIYIHVLLVCHVIKLSGFWRQLQFEQLNSYPIVKWICIIFGTKTLYSIGVLTIQTHHLIEKDQKSLWKWLQFSIAYQNAVGEKYFVDSVVYQNLAFNLNCKEFFIKNYFLILALYKIINRSVNIRPTFILFILRIWCMCAFVHSVYPETKLALINYEKTIALFLLTYFTNIKNQYWFFNSNFSVQNEAKINLLLNFNVRLCDKVHSTQHAVFYKLRSFSNHAVFLQIRDWAQCTLNKTFVHNPHTCRNTCVQMADFQGIRYVPTDTTKFGLKFKKNFLYYIRKNTSFNKGRFSRNRQIYRTGVYWCLWVNIIAVTGFYFWFYRFTMNFGYLWVFFFLFAVSFVISRGIKYNYLFISNLISSINKSFFWFYLYIYNFINLFETSIHKLVYAADLDLPFYYEMHNDYFIFYNDAIIYVQICSEYLFIKLIHFINLTNLFIPQHGVLNYQFRVDAVKYEQRRLFYLYIKNLLVVQNEDD